MLELILMLTAQKTEPITLALTQEPSSAITYTIEGEGFFRLEAEGEILYAKEVSIHVKKGKLVNETGLSFTPPVHVPSGAREIRISEYGYVYADINGKPKTLSQLVLARFSENTPFVQEGSLLKTSVRPTLGHPKMNGFGAVVPKQVPVLQANSHLQADTFTAPAKPTVSSYTPPLHNSNPPTHTPEESLAYTHIKVNPLSTVRGKEILLGAIAEITGPLAEKLRDLSLGPTPAIGTSRLITEITLQSALRSAKLSHLPISWEVPPKASVRRATRTLSGQEMESLAREWLQKNSYEPSQWRLSAPIPDRVIPDEEFTLTIERKQETETSLVLTLQVKNGEEILTTKQIAFLKTPPQTPSVKVGDRVRVIVLSGLVVVEAHGTVKSVGKRGEVTVALDDTGAILTGKIKPDGSVEVKL